MKKFSKESIWRAVACIAVVLLVIVSVLYAVYAGIGYVKGWTFRAETPGKMRITGGMTE